MVWGANTPVCIRKPSGLIELSSHLYWFIDKNGLNLYKFLVAKLSRASVWRPEYRGYESCLSFYFFPPNFPQTLGAFFAFLQKTANKSLFPCWTRGFKLCFDIEQNRGFSRLHFALFHTKIGHFKDLFRTFIMFLTILIFWVFEIL